MGPPCSAARTTTITDDDEAGLHAAAIVDPLTITRQNNNVELVLVLRRAVQAFDTAAKVRVSTCVRPHAPALIPRRRSGVVGPS